jgi:hypothetical protein
VPSCNVLYSGSLPLLPISITLLIPLIVALLNKNTV